MSTYPHPFRMAAWMAILSIAFLLTPSSGTADTASRKRVLLISSYHPGFPTFFEQIKGIKSLLDRYPIDLDIEFMDSKRFYSVEHVNRFREYLSHKLSRLAAYDVIMTADDNALSFALQYRQALFNQSPIVFFGVNDVDLAVAQNADPGVTGVVEAVSMRETIELIIALEPAIDTIFALVDDTPSGQGDLDTYLALGHAFGPVTLDRISLTRLTFDELAQTLETIDEHSAVLLLSAYRDKDGKTMDFADSLDLIRSHLKRPIYHLWCHGIGDGILGGKTICHHGQGREAARITMAIVNGTPVTDIPVVTQSPNTYTFDYNQLARFDIDRSRVPAGSTVINRPDSFYTRHRSLVWTGAAIFIGLSMVIVVLLVSVIRRRRAEAELERKVSERTVELKKSEALLRKSLLWRKEAVRAVNLGLWDWDLTTDTVHYSSVWKNQIGYAKDEIGDSLEEWKSRIHPDDLQAALEQTRQCTEGGRKRYQTEFRFRHKNGSYLWILSQGSILYDGNARPVRMIGSHVDITEREQLIGELQDALKRVKTLSGLLPICAKCKKIRDDRGYWSQIESYLGQHTDADFTHGYCPDCMDEMYGDQEWYQKGKRQNRL